MTELPDPAAGPEQAAERSDLRELVWNAAAGLSERDRALLDLHLRHGLEGAELGEAVGVEPGHAYVLLSRLRDQVDRALGALLVARLGRDECPELASILTGWDGRFSPLIRKRVARHVDACDVCGERRRQAASPLALLAAVPPMPAPAYLRGRVLERVRLTAGSGSGGDAGGDGGSGDGGPSGGGSGDAGAGPPGGSPGTGGSGSPGMGPGAGGPGSPGMGPGAGGPGSPAMGPGAGGPGSPAMGPGAGGPGSPGAPEPGPPVPGPPEGERSGAAGSGAAGFHSPRRRGALVALVAALLLAAATGVGLGWERSPAVSSPTDGQGGPIVAGAPTSVATSAPPTTAATSTSTSPPSSTTRTTGAPAAPASLAVTPARVDLGSAGASVTLTVRNSGDEPLSWSAGLSATWLRLRPSAGRLDGRGQARLTLSATRDTLPEGDADARVELTWGGTPRSVAVALRVEHPPEISGLSAAQPRIFTGPCTPTTTLVQATVTDESPLSSVTLRWGSASVPMAQRSGRWFAQLGPVTSPGTVSWQVVATDDRGNAASAPGPAVQVLACP